MEKDNKNLKDYLQENYPHLIREGELSLPDLKEELGEDIELSENFSFGLKWAEDYKGKEALRKEVDKSLVFDEEKSVNGNDTKNILIEGNNLEALKLLKKGYYGKIKMIYIDPPYNTGNDFIYKDNFKAKKDDYLEATKQIDEEGSKLTSNPKSDGRYHSNWLNMMYPRLKLARDLLTEDGVIFISIDDNEQANLKLLCNQIFGEENFLYSLSVVSKLNGNDNSSGMMETQEYCLIYAKNKTSFEIGVLLVDNEDEKSDWEEDDIGFWKEGGSLKATGENAPREARPNLFFPIYINDNNLDFSLEKNSEYSTELLPITDNKDMSWYWNKEKFLKDKNEVIVKKTKSGYSLYKKQRPALGNLPSKRGKTTFYHSKYSTSNSNIQIKNLFGEKIFSYSKSLELIEDLILLGNLQKDDIILDFFAGSGTTGHAVMELNKEDGGNRKYILVQLDEEVKKDTEATKAGYKTIVDITAERLRRAGNKIKESLNKKEEELFSEEKKELDIGFKYFKLNTPYFKNWDFTIKSEENLKNQIAKPKEEELIERTSKEIIYEALNKIGMQLDFSIQEIEKNNIYSLKYAKDNDVIIVLKKVTLELIEKIIKLNPATLVILETAFNNKNDNKINIKNILDKEEGFDKYYV